MKYFIAAIFLCFANSSFAQSFNNEWIDYSKTYYKFKIGKTGLYRIPQTDLAAQGLSNVPAEQFQLWRNGTEVPLFTSVAAGILPVNGFIEFRGEQNDGKPDRELYKQSSFQLSDKYSLETDTASYFLTINTSSNQRYTDPGNDLTGNTLQPLPYFMYNLRFDFRNQIHRGKAINYGQDVYSSSYDEGEGFTSSNITLSNPFSISSANLRVAPTGPVAKFTIGVAGSSSLGSARTVQCMLNGNKIIETPLGAYQAVIFSANVPLNMISNNSLDVIVKNAPDAFDRIVTSFAELKYPRQFDFNNASEFQFELPANTSKTFISISNFNYGNVAPLLLDLTNNRRYIAVIDNGVFKFLLQPSTQPMKLILVNASDANVFKTGNFTKKNFINYNLSANQAEYIIISNKLLTETGTAVEQYRVYRSSVQGGNYISKVYIADELADQFSFGIKNHPSSIKNFLRFARQQFSIKPKFCLLLGKAVSYPEYRENENAVLADQLNLVPTFGWPASDVLLASDNLDPIAATPIGRVSVVNNQEVLNYLEKLKSYETQQANTVQTIANKEWMKNIVFVAGANSPGLDGLFTGYFNGYQSKIEDSLFGAKTTVFSNLTTGPPTPATNQLMQTLFSDGISIVNYFGHSNAISLDYNLDDPSSFNNPGKYPVFLINGCDAGNIYSYDPGRLQAISSLAEKFVLAPKGGAIAFIGNSHYGITNYLDAFNTGFYQSLQKQNYNDAVSLNIRAGAQYLLNQSFVDSATRYLQAEETIINGDPAIKINGHAKPDFAIEEQDIFISPSLITIAQDSFDVKIMLHNLGKYQGDSVQVTIKRAVTNISQLIKDVTIKAFGIQDSLLLKLPVSATFYKGENKITVLIDAQNKYDELSESNNTATKTFQVIDNAITQLYPYHLSIVPDDNFKFYVSTADPFISSKTYYLEMDTTTLFNSPMKFSTSVESVGGLVEFQKPALIQNLVYYWRAGVEQNGVINWKTSSFIFIPGENGFNQSHLFQHQQSSLQQINVSTGNQWDFAAKQKELSVSIALYPTSGTVDGHFSISVDGEFTTKSACVGHSVVLNVFDPKTLKPLYNQAVPSVVQQGTAGGFMGSAGICAESRATNFEFSIMTADSRNLIKKFIDWIPAGYYVVVRNINDPNVQEPYVDTWKTDKAKFGDGNTLYDALKQNGFTDLDSYTYNRVFGFIYKKNDAVFKPLSKFSDGLYDLRILKTEISVKDSTANILSPKVGPATAWKSFNWNGSGVDNYNKANAQLSITGIDNSGNKTILKTINPLTTNIDLYSISAKQYPMLQLQLNTHDGNNYIPYQLNNWRVLYDPVPEGAIAPAIKFVFKDSVAAGEPVMIGVPFKNISNQQTDSFPVTISITDKLNQLHIYSLPKTRKLNFSDTAWITTTIDTKNLIGSNMVYVDVNPQLQKPEKTHENNFFYRKLIVGEDNYHPLLDVTFDGVHIMNNDIVSSKPNIQIRLKDESKYLLLDDTSLVSVQLRKPDNTLRTIKYAADTLKFTAATNTDNTAVIEYTPWLPDDGDYELIVKAKDKSGNAVSANDFKTAFRVFNKPMISDMFNYPNPFTTSTAFVFTITGSKVPQNLRIQILTITGKIVKEITAAELGTIRVGKNITDYKWDGTDMYGQKLANGVYLYRIITNLDNKSLDHFDLQDEQGNNISTNKFFNKGYGKMYLLR
jgi:hypothetical protein